MEATIATREHCPQIMTVTREHDGLRNYTCPNCRIHHTVTSKKFHLTYICNGKVIKTINFSGCAGK